MSALNNFFENESGAVTVDWVVLTAGIVGLGLATMAVVSGGVEDLSGDVNTQLASQTISTSFGSLGLSTDWNGWTASDYVAAAAPLAPGNNGAIYAHATNAAAGDSPAGFNFSDPLYETGSGNIVYTSDDGQYYSIGGEVIAVNDYQGQTAYFGA